MEKYFILGDSHLKRIHEYKFKESLPNTYVYILSFCSANTTQIAY